LIACFSAFPSFGNAAMESEDPGRSPGSCAVGGDEGDNSGPLQAADATL
jgi:hypothetical protein